MRTTLSDGREGDIAMLPEAEMETMPNGLRIVYAPDPMAESASFGLFVASGSRHEGETDAGASHFIEHMLFKGTRTRTALAISQAIEGRGGNFNAWTSEENTCFYAYLPAEGLPVAIDILCDMYLHAAMPAAEFARERRVIVEEIRMYDDEPDSVASENLSKLLFPDNALGRPIAGSEKSLAAMTPAYLKRYMRRAYVPRATVAVVAGRFSRDAVRKRICRHLGLMRDAPAPVSEPVRRNSPVKPECRAERDVQQMQLAIGYKSFGLTDDRRFAAAVFDTLMGRSMSSRLFQAVRERKGLSYDIHSQLSQFKETGAWCVMAGLDPARSDLALKTICAELDRIRQKKVPAAELARTKEYIVGNFRLGFEQPRSRLFYFGLGALAFGKIIPPVETVERFSAITADDVLAAAQAILRDNRRAVSWVLPKNR